MIKIENLSKNFGKAPVLSNISFEVKSGEVFGIIGKSGAGKSTLIKCLNLLERPNQGQVIVNGIDLTAMNKEELRLMRQNIGMIFQGFNLLSAKTVFDNVALPLRLHGKHSRVEIKNKVEKLLDLVGLSQFANKYPVSLSGGQKQRVAIARAIATDPIVLLSDEATSSLDPQTTNSILELLLDINEKLGLTIVLITHEIEVVRKICDRVAIIDDGRIIEVGKTVDIILHPREELTRKLILEEETGKYLEQVANYYRFEKNDNNQLVILSFIGNKTFEPILSTIFKESGITFSILRGELGRIKNMPFGQLLIEISGQEAQLKTAFAVIDKLSIHYEIIN